jgi:hypothetical protein
MLFLNDGRGVKMPEMNNEVFDYVDLDQEQLVVLKEMSSKLDDMYRELREIKVRINNLDK